MEPSDTASSEATWSEVGSSSTMSSRTKLVSLPYELRTQIFQHYFKLKGGYVYHGESEKLVTADCQPIDLTHHLQGIRGVISDADQHFTVDFTRICRNHGFDDTKSYRGIFSERFGEPYIPWSRFTGGRPSFSDAMDYTLRLLAEKHPVEFASLVDEAVPGWTVSNSPLDYLNLTFDPWAILSLSEVISVGNTLGARGLWKCLEEWYYNPLHKGGVCRREKLYVSAAAVAIRFLNQLPTHDRLCIRNIILNEDRVALGNPQSHARGLIPFCKENPGLQIERRVNLWRNILLRKNRPPLDFVGDLAEGEPDRQWRASMPAHRDLESQSIDHDLVPWLGYALDVMDEGMPAGSFSFVLDGEPDLDLSSDLFDKVIHRQVAWKKSYNQCVAQGLFPHAEATAEEQRGGSFWLPNDHLLDVVDELMSGSSILKSNFNLGQPWDYEQLIVEHQEPDAVDWMYKIEGSEPQFFPFPALVDPIKLRLEMFEMQRQREDLNSSFQISKREKKRLRRARPWRVMTLTAEFLGLGSHPESDSDSDSMEEGMRLLFEDAA
ncbi:hypothetical protein AK830_g63 [Neonectria ditissima]|uniref:Uncharacterized protein n=1 Tax=Neonectria ditissima TaxID=78410 RepID=A0A0P7BYA6_9HYPO|nr:hypothetical protein AK830_g63 [Neonectria ditissima]